MCLVCPQLHKRAHGCCPPRGLRLLHHLASPLAAIKVVIVECVAALLYMFLLVAKTAGRAPDSMLPRWHALRREYRPAARQWRGEPRRQERH